MLDDRRAFSLGGTLLWRSILVSQIREEIRASTNVMCPTDEVESVLK